MEVHVYLQRGRIAWATDSGHPFEFSRDLTARGRIEPHVFREVLDACRRDRLPLGETLVAWKLATLDDVRASLAHQVSIALGSLGACGAAPTVFLQRRSFADYDERLTFDLTEVLGGRVEPRREDVPPPPPPAAPVTARTARELLALVKGASWVEVLEAGRSIDAAGHAAGPRVCPAFAAASLSHGADFLAVRSDDGCLVGTRLGGSERQMWAMLAADATFGAAVAGLFAAGALARRPRSEVARDVVWKRGGPEVDGLLGEAFAFGRDVLAVALLDGDALAFGMGRGLAEDECLAVARRRAAVFAANPLAAPAAGSPASLGFDRRTLVTGEDRVWCFGAELHGSAPRTLWVFTRRHGSQGIGWACLTALSRAISQREPRRA